MKQRGPQTASDTPSLTDNELRVLKIFRQFLMTPGKMLCFFGPDLKKYGSAFRRLTDRDFLVKEQFKGGYSLTRAGFLAMQRCD